MRPRLLREVLQRYDGRPWPPDHIVRRLLLEGHYSSQQIQRAVAVINRNVRDFHLLDRSGGQRSILRLAFVEGLSARPPGAESSDSARPVGPPRARTYGGAAQMVLPPQATQAPGIAPAQVPRGEPERALATRGRVYLSVPMDSPLVGQLSEVLTFGGYLPILPPDEPSPALSPEVMDRMRGCSAVVVDLRPDLGRPPEPDDESLMRIGAAVALCGDRTVFLCPADLAMPPVVEHLPHVHYDGQSLDYESTMAVVRTFNRIRGIT
jgi:hypothetical protein